MDVCASTSGMSTGSGFLVHEAESSRLAVTGAVSIPSAV